MNTKEQIYIYIEKEIRKMEVILYQQNIGDKVAMQRTIHNLRRHVRALHEAERLELQQQADNANKQMAEILSACLVGKAEKEE